MDDTPKRKQLLAATAVTLILGILLLWQLSLTPVFAFQVPQLPNDNLVTNPWFRRDADPTFSGLDHWTDAAGLNKYWSSSQKESNPSPDIVVSGVCGGAAVYCGTGARLSLTQGQSGGIAQPGVDAYLYQVVSADASKRKLKFFTHWVSHLVEPAEVIIYGGQTTNGPWNSIWVPFYHVQQTNPPPPHLWTNTGFQELVIDEGYPYYKIEIHARLPDDEQVGFKITGVYFAVEPVGGGPLPTPTRPPNLDWECYLPVVTSR